MKQVNLTIALLLLTVFANLKAQEIGISINRGVTHFALTTEALPQP